MDDLPEILTVQETAKYLRLKRSTAYELVKQGIIPSVKFGRQIRVPKAGVLNIFQQVQQGKTSGGAK